MEGKLAVARFSRWLVIGAAIVASIVFVHWFTALPAPAVLVRGDYPLFVQVLYQSGDSPTGAWFLRLALGLIATAGIAASALAVIIALKAAQTPAIRHLGAALALGSLAAAYFFFVTTHDVYRQNIGWSWGNGWRAALDFLFYSLDLVTPLFLIHFFRTYPRDVTDEQLQTHYAEIMAEARVKVSQGWRKRIYPQRGEDPAVPTRAERFVMWGGAPQQQMARVQRFWISSAMYWCAIVIAFFAATAGYFGRLSIGSVGTGSTTNMIEISSAAASAFVLLFFVYGAQISFENLQFHHRQAVPEDRARIDWIYATMLVSGVVLLAVSPVWWALLIWLIPYLEAHGVVSPGPILFIGPTVISIEIFVLAFLASLALSIFYRGAVDPRLAARKITLFGLLGLLTAFLFILIERTVALKLIAHFQLSPDTGALIAGASVAGTIAPIKRHAEKAINSFVGRFLPLDSMIAGDRKTVVVALSDLSGYTLLSSHDEKQALLLAALLQRQAKKLTDAHGGRIVKSMGDAVMFAFDDAPSAVSVLTTLHREFATVAGEFGLAALQVHSGVHFGDVTVAHDGDLYGQTVNIAARIQGAAAPGQIVVSETFALAAEDANYRTLGPKSFKNVPDVIVCYELLTPSPPAEVALQ